jgi:hypothetical protein
MINSIFFWSNLFHGHIIYRTTVHTLISRTLIARQLQPRLYSLPGEDTRMDWKECHVFTIKKHLLVSNDLQRLLEIQNTSFVLPCSEMKIVGSCLSAGGLLDEWTT